MKVKSHDEILKLVVAPRNKKEEMLKTKIRNGQHVKGINQALCWVIEEQER